MDFKFVHTDKGICKGCGKETRGGLLAEGQETIPCCPRCRDTKSIFLRITGQDRDEVSVLSTRSSAVEAGVSQEDQIPPMLARAIADVKPAEMVSQIKQADNWIVAEKYDGARFVCYFRNGKTVFLGRNKTQGTGQYSDRSANVPHLHMTEALDSLDGTVLDGELIFLGGHLDTGSASVDNVLNATVALVNCSPEKSIALQEKFGKLVYVVFDIMKFQGQDLRDSSLADRMVIRHQALNLIAMRNPEQAKYYREERWLQCSAEEKEAFFNLIVSEGGEGVMYKNLFSTYCRQPTSRPVSWVKRKKRITVDGFISGYKPGEAGFKGLVGALVVSVFEHAGELLVPVEIAMVSNLELELRRKMSAPDGSLRPEYLNQVVEVSFQEISSRSKRGRHATLELFRPDKSASDCIQ